MYILKSLLVVLLLLLAVVEHHLLLMEVLLLLLRDGHLLQQTNGIGARGRVELRPAHLPRMALRSREPHPFGRMLVLLIRLLLLPLWLLLLGRLLLLLLLLLLVLALFVVGLFLLVVVGQKLAFWVWNRAACKQLHFYLLI